MPVENVALPLAAPSNERPWTGRMTSWVGSNIAIASPARTNAIGRPASSSTRRVRVIDAVNAVALVWYCAAGLAVTGMPR